MRVYHERLTVPPAWWALGVVVILILGAELAAGLGWLAAGIIYAVLAGSYAALLVSWGRARIVVANGELAAGPRRAPLSAITEVAPLDQAQTHAMRGPSADPAAFMLVRPYLRTAVFVRMRDQPDAPYWLLGTRDPAGLAHAIGSSLPTLRADGPAVG